RIPCTIGWTFARINADGEVNSCLKSHKIPVGNIYHHSFSEIWNGEKQQWFREHSLQRKKNDPFFHMIGNDPMSSMGCEKTCDDLGRNRFMNDKINALPFFMRWILSAAALYYRRRKKTSPPENNRHLPPAIAGFMDGKKVFTGPEEVAMDLTNACSLQCMPCFIHSPLLINPPDPSWFKQKLEFNSLKQCLADLQEMGTQRIRLTGGGDPLCYPEIISVITACKEMGFYTAITTGLYKVDPPALKTIIESGVDEISVSLMAASEQMYLKIHPKTAPQDFEKILTQIMQLTASRKIKVVLCHVIMNANYQEIADMAILAGKLNVNALYYTLMDPVDTGLSGLVLSEAERQKASVLCREVDDLRAKGLIPFLEGWDAFKSHLTAGTKKPPVDAVPCSVGWHFSRILADGTVVPCCKGVHYSVGNIHDKSFKELWKNERYTQFRIHCKNLSSSADFFNAFRCQSCDNEEHNRNFNQALKNHTDQIK
ncbi:MAG: SPASM domain-containing protein, partial [Candidatus Aureabacteria bacterium]|nr:SPASM domain-containing protein [Candidatus Auribacterota bacterium]